MVTTRLRVDIQILRAVAVLLVIAGHFWPGAFPGGFAGVDIFFVISGFLITSLMVNEIGRTGRLSLVNFWARRIRRIMPAAFVVIASTAAAVVLIGSPDQIRILTRHVIASSLSAENLLLAWDAVDYDRREDSTSPLQHFWSLAVEEQFYVVWPLIVGFVLTLVTLARRFRWSFRPVLTAVIIALTLGSFAYALSLDPGAPASYFDPFARAWELGVGATVAVWGGTVLSSAGNAIRYSAVIAAAVVLIGTAFVPGLNAATPGIGVLPAVLATAAVIALAVPLNSFRNPVPQLGVRTLSWIGDRSYSLYLWHWPLLILTPLALERSLNLPLKVALLIVIFGLSMVSYRFVEQPFRSTDSPVIRRPRFLFPVAALSTVALIAGTVVFSDPRPSAETSVNTDALLPGSSPDPLDAPNPDYPHVSAFCFGAGAAVFDCPEVTKVSYDADTLPSFPVESATCIQSENSDYTRCVFGDRTSPRSIALVGDSHAKALWVAGDSLGKRIGAAVHMFFRNGCAYSTNRSPGCSDITEIVRERMLAGEFEFVIFAQSLVRREALIQIAQTGVFQQAYQELIDEGIPFVVLKDNPRLEDEAFDCLKREFRNPKGCAVSRDRGFVYRDFAFEAATELGVPTIDFTDIYCGETECPVSIGGVRVYRDRGHITTVFGKSLVPFLENDLTELGFLPFSRPR
jgi:peptidoglycan/LPS O-acetylase OafA/YrhL